PPSPTPFPYTTLFRSDVRRRPGRGRVRTDAAAGEREPPAGPVADVRHHLSPAPLRTRRERARFGAGHGAAQRRAGPEQHGDHRLDGTWQASALRAAPGPASAVPAGPR